MSTPRIFLSTARIYRDKEDVSCGNDQNMVGSGTKPILSWRKNESVMKAERFSENSRVEKLGSWCNWAEESKFTCLHMEGHSGQNYTELISCCFVFICTLFSILLMDIIYFLMSAIYFWLASSITSRNTAGTSATVPNNRQSGNGNALSELWRHFPTFSDSSRPDTAPRSRYGRRANAVARPSQEYAFKDIIIVGAGVEKTPLGHVESLRLEKKTIV